MEELNNEYAEDDWLFVYGDAAYHESIGILRPYQHPQGHRYLPQHQRAFNTALSSARVAIENAFGAVSYTHLTLPTKRIV